MSPLLKQIYKYFQRCSCVSNIVIKDNRHFNMYNMNNHIIIRGRYGAYKDSIQYCESEYRIRCHIYVRLTFHV